MTDARNVVKRDQLQLLGTALVCDVLDSLGERNSFVGPALKAVWPCGAVAGTALTIRCAPYEDVEAGAYGVLFDTLADRHDHSILVITKGDSISGLWGGLLTVAAQARGVVGVVVDGLTRDVGEIVAAQFPVFARGTSPLDSAGRQNFAEFGGPVLIGDVVVNPGDWVVADELGVAVCPHQHIDQVIALGLEKMRGESTVRSELSGGADIGDVFRHHGIL